MKIYSVIGFPVGGGRATFQREYKRRGTADKVQESLASSEEYVRVVLRVEDILVDDGKAYISIDTILRVMEGCTNVG